MKGKLPVHLLTIIRLGTPWVWKVVVVHVSQQNRRNLRYSKGDYGKPA